MYRQRDINTVPCIDAPCHAHSAPGPSRPCSHPCSDSFPLRDIARHTSLRRTHRLRNEYLTCSCHGSPPSSAASPSGPTANDFRETSLSALPLAFIQAKPGCRGAILAQIIAEPDCFYVWRLSRQCRRFCQRATFWCGYKTIFKPGDGRRGRKLKLVDAPDALRAWLRRWRYRLFLRRASFQAEAILLRLLHTQVRVRLREQLRQLWAREILCRRSEEAAVAADFHKRVLNGPWNSSLLKRGLGASPSCSPGLGFAVASH